MLCAVWHVLCLVTSCGALWNANAAQAWARVPVHWTKHHAPMTVKSSHLAATARAWAVGIIGCLSTEWMHPAPDLQHPLCLLAERVYPARTFSITMVPSSACLLFTFSS